MHDREKNNVHSGLTNLKGLRLIVSQSKETETFTFNVTLKLQSQVLKIFGKLQVTLRELESCSRDKTNRMFQSRAERTMRRRTY
jgi:selenocysteine lyase/cysteine desulfurase